MLNSLRSRLVLSYLLVILIAMGIAAALAGTALDRAFNRMLADNLLAQAERVAQTLADEGWAEPSLYTTPTLTTTGPLTYDLYSQVSNVMPGVHSRLIAPPGSLPLDEAASAWLYAPGGELEVVTTAGPEGSDDFVPLAERTEVQAALNGQPATASRTYPFAPRRRVLYAAYPVRAPDGGVLGVAYVASPTPRFSLAALPGQLPAQLLGGAAAAVLLAGVAGFFLARGLTRPLQRLTRAAGRLARGERVEPLPPAGTAELDQLGRAFNDMVRDLDAAQAALAAEAQEKQAILDHLADGVLLADAGGSVSATNPAGQRWLALGEEHLAQPLRQTLADGEPVSSEVIVGGQVAQVLTQPLRDETGDLVGAVAVCHDVTPFRQLDRLRTNLISDVSHELRTPLSAIKGYVETLQDGAVDDPAVRDRFLATVGTETERLIRLVNDLLTLTRADADRLDLNLAPTDLAALAHDAAERLLPRSRAKGVRVRVQAQDGLPPVPADADRIRQVLLNLLDNAIKFSPDGAQVVVKLTNLPIYQSTGAGKLVHWELGDRVLVSVHDEGPGIPPEDQPHVFERFYRADPSRARGDGAGQGSGLGLAIAKAIVEAHEGEIGVESDGRKGTRVYFVLPQLVKRNTCTALRLVQCR